MTFPLSSTSNIEVLVGRMHDVTFESHNVLADEDIRQGIKDYSNWPTIPQVYIKGTFVGGCDIMKEMHADGSLEELLIREGIIKTEVANR